MTSYIVSYNFNRSGRLFTFRCTAISRTDAMEQCLAFYPGVLVIGTYTEEELKHHPTRDAPERIE